MKYGFLFGAGAEVAYKLPLGGQFALDIFRQDTSTSKNIFKKMRENVDGTTVYANRWLPKDYIKKKCQYIWKVSFSKYYYEYC